MRYEDVAELLPGIPLGALVTRCIEVETSRPTGVAACASLTSAVITGPWSMACFFGLRGATAPGWT